MSGKITSYWAKSVVDRNIYLICYWHKDLKQPIMVKVSEQPLTGEKLW